MTTIGELREVTLGRKLLALKRTLEELNEREQEIWAQCKSLREEGEEVATRAREIRIEMEQLVWGER